MIARLKRLGVWQLLLALGALVLVLAYGVPRWDGAERPQLYEAALLPEGAERAPAGTQTLRLSGASLYRVNTLRIDGRRVPLRYVETVGYGECLLCVDEGTFVPGESVRVSVGKRTAIPPLELFQSNTITFTVQ